MRKNEYQIVKKNIPHVILYHAGGYWYDNNFNLVPWLETDKPKTNDVVLDITWFNDITYTLGDVIFYNKDVYKSLRITNLNKNPATQTAYWEKLEDYSNITTKNGKYYKWNGTSWVNITKIDAQKDYQVPIFLDADVDEWGVMVGFDGEIEQVEQLCNFTYAASGNVVTVYNTASTNRLKRIIDAVFTINWGDGSATTTVGILGNKTHTYSTSGAKTITVTMNAPWKVETVTKSIVLPLVTSGTNPLGTLTFSIPYVEPVATTTQNYLNSLDYNPPTYTGSTFVGVGTSRISELKKYGSSNTYSGVTTGTTVIDGTTYSYSGYTLDGLTYKDLSDGRTYISGTITEANGWTFESVTSKMLTRNEHFLGFVTDMTVYSDVFVERGKQGVTEHNLRLSEIDNVGELDIYGNGFYTVRKS
jgi:hypothetical protein